MIIPWGVLGLGVEQRPPRAPRGGWEQGCRPTNRVSSSVGGGGGVHASASPCPVHQREAWGPRSPWPTGRSRWLADGVPWADGAEKPWKGGNGALATRCHHEISQPPAALAPKRVDTPPALLLRVDCPAFLSDTKWMHISSIVSEFYHKFTTTYPVTFILCVWSPC